MSSKKWNSSLTSHQHVEKLMSPGFNNVCIRVAEDSQYCGYVFLRVGHEAPLEVSSCFCH